ncbi:MAG: HAD hydrolase-like protein, partial [Kiritimatiellae bacterium]|nr:HAD hydrolase-like protein [Kiritimatiellia bacterium]
MQKARAISFDFYKTLVRPAGSLSRGQKYHQYLAEQGLSAEPWEHKVLYDVFEYYGTAYRPWLSPTAKAEFWVEFTWRLFLRTGVRDERPERHAETIRRIFGPDHFMVFPEAVAVLERLRELGLRLAMVSNWQKGLSFFCEELGILRWFDVVVCSAEFGVEKPDRRIFEEAVRRLGLS